jgi:hypothetical protein
MFKRGIARVSGTEKEDNIPVIVEMYIELQAPPEQTLRGVERDDRIFKSIYFIMDLDSFF